MGARTQRFYPTARAANPTEPNETGTTGYRPKVQSLGFDAILEKRNLGAWRRSC
jgi:hypothetical protein